MSLLRSALIVGLLLVSSSAWAQKPPPSRWMAIQSTPPGATVYLGDKTGAPLGKTPLKRVKVPLGFREFVFALDGYRDEKVGMEVTTRTPKVEATLLRLAKVVLRAGNEGTEGAEVLINGKSVGTMALETELEPGRIQIEVKKAGHNPFSQWVEVKGGEILSFQVALTPVQQPVGTIFVTADVSGAIVLVDGVERGRTPASLELPPGPALLEIRADKLPPWKTTVNVEPGKKAIVEAKMRPEAAPRGSALVLSNVPGTIIWIDGVKTGTAPVTKTDLMVGSHIVEATADGFEPAQAVLQTKEGEQTVLKLELKPVQAEFGRISVRASVPEAQVFVDGGDKGQAPVELDQVPLGVHAVVVRVKGYQNFESTCEVKRNQLCNVMAEMKAMAPVRVTSAIADASLILDGKEVGPLPYEGTLVAGEHIFRVEAKEYLPIEKKVTLEPSAEVRVLTFNLEKPGASVAPVAREYYQGASAFTGVPLGPGANTLDVMLGVPYLVEVRGTLGLIDKLAVGVGARVLQRNLTNGLAELSVRAQTGLRPLNALSIGAEVEGWAGTNFDSSNTFGGSLLARGTLHFKDRAAFSLWFAGDILRDKWVNRGGISDGQEGRTNPRNGSQTLGRFRVGGAVTLWLKPKMGLLASLDGIAAGDPRLLMRETLFGSINEDPQLYARFGMIFSF